MPNYLSDLLGQAPVPTDDPVFAAAEGEVRERTGQFMAINGTQSVDHFHRELGKIMWDYCGMERACGPHPLGPSQLWLGPEVAHT